MSMNSTPSSERLHIGIFGERNVGKSSLINALTGQNLAIVSPVKGTTTDPVRKAMELLPLGPVVLIDTPGVDDQGELGQQRVKKSYQTLNSCDLAILVSVLGKEFSLRGTRDFWKAYRKRTFLVFWRSVSRIECRMRSGMRGRRNSPGSFLSFRSWQSVPLPGTRSRK